MKRILTVIVTLCALFLGACSTTPENDTDGRKPTRQSNSGDLPWAKPASWEGGLPGMPNNAPR